MRYIVFISFGLLLAACATDHPENVRQWSTATIVSDERAEQALLIECSGSLNALSMCYRRARLECPNGYATLEAAALQTAGSGVVTTSDGSLYGATVSGSERSIVVRCNEGV